LIEIRFYAYLYASSFLVLWDHCADTGSWIRGQIRIWGQIWIFEGKYGLPTLTLFLLNCHYWFEYCRIITLSIHAYTILSHILLQYVRFCMSNNSWKSVLVIRICPFVKSTQDVNIWMEIPIQRHLYIWANYSVSSYLKFIPICWNVLIWLKYDFIHISMHHFSLYFETTAQIPYIRICPRIQLPVSAQWSQSTRKNDAWKYV
jgi:hypothetical protein